MNTHPTPWTPTAIALTTHALNTLQHTPTPPTPTLTRQLDQILTDNQIPHLVATLAELAATLTLTLAATTGTTPETILADLMTPPA